MHRIRSLRRDSTGLAEIVGTLLLVLIVVGAAVAFSLFVAAYQAQVQAEESAAHTRSLEDIRILSVATVLNSTDGEVNFSSLSFVAGSLDVNTMTVNELEINGLLINFYTVTPLGSAEAVQVCELCNRADPLFSHTSLEFNLTSLEQATITVNLTTWNPTLQPHGGFFTPYNLTASGVADFVSISLYTTLGNDFHSVFLPPTAVPLVEQSETYSGGNYTPVLVFDGSQSLVPANDTIVSWSWLIRDGSFSLSLSGEKALELQSDVPAGAYSVTLVVTSSDGLSDTATIPYQVGASVPTDLLAAPVNSTAIGLTWTNPSGTLTDDHAFEYAGATCSGTPTAFDLGSVVTSYTATGLTADTAYSFTVAASTSEGEGAPSACASATTGNIPPAAPTDLVPTVLSDSEIGLTWTNPSGPLTDNHVYEYSDTTCSGTPTSINIGSVVSSYSATALSADTPYSFNVTASTNGGQGPPSSCVFATTDNAPPAAPTGLTATAESDSNVTLAWTNPAGPVTDNHVNEYLGSSCSGTATAINIGSVVATYTVTGLSGDTTYSFNVTASTNGGEGPPSSCANATTEKGPPAAPTGVTEVSGPPTTTTTIGITWANPPGAVTGVYVLEASYSTGACGTYTTPGSGQSAELGNVTSDTWTGLAAGDAYCFEVEAVNTFGTSGPSTPLADASTITAAPTALASGTLTDTTVPLTWTPPATSPSSGVITSYTVLQAAYTTTCGAFSRSYTGAPEPYTVTGLSADTAYCFEVEAVDAGGTSAASNVLTDVVTPAATPPSGLTEGVATTTTIPLAWTNPTGAIADQVLQAPYTGTGSCATATYGSVYTSTIPLTVYTVTGLTIGNGYCFEVESEDASGWSAPSTPLANADTLTAAPTALASGSVTTTTVVLTWTAPATAPSVGVVASYTVQSATYTSGVCGAYGGPETIASGGTYSGLSPGTSYCYEVATVDTGGTSAYSVALSNVATLPSAPTLLSAGAYATTSLTLSWTNPVGATADQVFEAFYSGTCGSYTSVYVSGHPASTYTVTGLTPATAYCFEVQARDASGYGANATLTDIVTLPGSPSNLVEVTGSPTTWTSIGLTWTNPSGTLVGDYLFEASYATGSCGSFVASAEQPVITSYTWKGLTSGDAYCFYVEAVTASGSGAASTSLTNAPTITAAPTGLAGGAVTDSSVVLTWTAPTTSPSSGVITSYSVQSTTYSGSCTLPYGNAETLASGGTYTGLSGATAYCFEVAAVDAGGTSNYSTALTDVVTLPAAPTILVEVSGSPTTTTSVGLTWTNPSGTLTGDYVFEAPYATGSCGSYTESAERPVSTSYTWTGLTSGDAYCFYVEAASSSGSGAASAPLTGAPTITGAPTALTAGVPTNTTVPLTWTAPSTSPSSGVISSYTVLEAAYTTACGAFSSYATAVPESPYTVTGLSPSTSYCFEVEAVDAGGVSAASNNVSNVMTLSGPLVPFETTKGSASPSTPTVIGLALTSYPAMLRAGRLSDPSSSA